MTDFDIQIVHSVTETDQTDWDRLGNGQPFTSYRWYRFGETVMNDCIPVYIILSQDGQMLARATFWVIRNEPLPIPWVPLRYAIQTVLQHWPLFACRSPLANASGLILPEMHLRQSAMETLINVAKEEARRYKTSFLLFDYMEAEQTNSGKWPKGFLPVAIQDPGTVMEITWSDFDEYLASLKPKVRKHYRQYNREAEKLSVKILCQDHVTDIEPALALVRKVEQRHRSSPNPWAQSLLENAKSSGAIWVTAKQNDRLVGCELILDDNGTQMVASLGMAADFPHIYFLLGYADIRHAIEKGYRFLRWGSGAFEAKQRLGFELENNNYIVLHGTSPVFQTITRLMS